MQSRLCLLLCCISVSCTGGSAAFILAIVMYAPNEEILQIGGYQNYLTSQRLWNRMWPVQWTATTTPYGGGSHWMASR
jgi:hypothetical protein